MTVLFICIGILLVLTALLLLRVGVRVVYNDTGLFLYLKFVGFSMLVMPNPPLSEEEKASKERKKQAKEARKAAKKKQKKCIEASEIEAKGSKVKKGTLSFFLRLVKPGLETLNRLRIKTRITHLHIDYAIAGAEDPAQAAIRYGIVSAGGGALFPLINEAFRVSAWDVNMGIDFNQKETYISLDATATLFLGHLLVIAAIFAYQAYTIYTNDTKGSKGGTQ